jgi:hypothetical protein
MNHEVYQQHISQLVDNELSESLEQDLFLHLGSCRECRSFLKSSWQIQSDIQKRMPRTQPGFANAKGPSQTQKLQDHPSVGSGFNRKTARAPIRTFALAVLVVALACIMFSTTITVEPQSVAQNQSFQPQVGMNGN